MKQNRTLRYLSNRVKLLVAFLAGIVLFLTAILGVSYAQGAPFWPVGTALLLLIGCLALGYALIARPFEQLERMTDLFAEGYTLPGSKEGIRRSLSPATEKLLLRVSDELSTPQLLKLSKRQAQYRSLQNQINPHFLYNTLESIRSEALIAGLHSVADMTEALAVFFRYTISKVENLVSLEEELQNCQTYFRIQQYRFGARLKLQIECDPADRESIYHSRVPKLTLQPILENSIIHGTESKIGAGNLIIHLERTQKRLLIRVSDDGIGMDEGTLAMLNERLSKSGLSYQDGREGSKGGLALTNVNHRIHLLFGEEFGLHVYSMPGMGTDVEISLPLIASDRDVNNPEVLP